eukprot:4394580-Amphidinium_carterae.1
MYCTDRLQRWYYYGSAESSHSNPPTKWCLPIPTCGRKGPVLRSMEILSWIARIRRWGYNNLKVSIQR